MEEYLKSLKGITFKDWQKLKFIVDNEFVETKYKSTFNLTEDTLEELKAIL